MPFYHVQICEDSAQELNSEELGRPLNQLVPMLLALFSHPKDSFRVTALKCMNNLIQLSPQALLLNMDAYLEVCEGFHGYLDIEGRLLLTGMEGGVCVKD